MTLVRLSSAMCRISKLLQRAAGRRKANIGVRTDALAGNERPESRRISCFKMTRKTMRRRNIRPLRNKTILALYQIKRETI